MQALVLFTLNAAAREPVWPTSTMADVELSEPAAKKVTQTLAAGLHLDLAGLRWRQADTVDDVIDQVLERLTGATAASDLTVST